MIGKITYSLIILVSIAVVINAELPSDIEFEHKASDDLSHNLIVGARQPGDRLVLKQNVVKDSKWLQIVTTEQNFKVSPYETITQIRALDQKTNGKGATASLLGGGPGASDTTLRFKSQRGHGINFVVEIYAKG